MDEFLAAAENVRTRMWRTAGARFFAVVRLTRRDNLSTFSIAMLSVVAIAIGLLNPDPVNNRVSALAVNTIISVFILTIGLVEGARQSSVKAAKLHDNAASIASLRSNLELLLTRCREAQVPDHQALGELNADYQLLISECPFNHDALDDDRFVVQHRLSPEFRQDDGQPKFGRIAAGLIQARHLLSSAWLPALSWLVILCLAWSAFNWTEIVTSNLPTQIDPGSRPTVIAPR